MSKLICLQSGHEGRTTGATGTWVYPYIAGIIDGEGCIRIKMSKPTLLGKSIRFESLLSVSNTNEKLISFLHNKFGGSVYSRKRHDWKPEIVWTISNKQFEQLIPKVIEYLQLKKEQALLCMKLRELTGTKMPSVRLSENELVKRLDLFLQIKKLNEKGVSDE